VGNGATLTASNTTFTYSWSSGNSYIAVNAGGNLVANNETTFKLSSVTLNSGSSAKLTTGVFYNVLSGMILAT
jgi:hypothetical protein